ELQRDARVARSEAHEARTVRSRSLNPGAVPGVVAEDAGGKRADAGSRPEYPVGAGGGTDHSGKAVRQSHDPGSILDRDDRGRKEDAQDAAGIDKRAARNALDGHSRGRRVRVLDRESRSRGARGSVKRQGKTASAQKRVGETHLEAGGILRGVCEL